MQETPDDNTYELDSLAPPMEPVRWTASEFIVHDKTAGWYGRLAAASLVTTAIVYFLTRDIISSAVVIIAAAVLGFYANRQPRQLSYLIDAQGLSIGERQLGFESFRSFAIVPDGAFSSIVFMPLRRFSPTTTIYFSPADEQQIVAILASRLPVTEHNYDLIERLMSRIRF